MTRGEEIELEIRALQDGTAVILVNGEKKAEIAFAPTQEDQMQKGGLTRIRGMLNGVSGKAELTIRFQSQKPGELAELYRIRQAVR